MSYSLDANVLVHAANADSPGHKKARRFLEACALNPEPLCLTWGVVMGFLRLSTHLAIFKNPLTPALAMEAMDDLLDLPQARLLTEEPGFWKVYRAVGLPLSPRGKAVPDTHLAALLRFHEVRRLYSSDRDFRRFDFLEVIDPLKER